MSEGLKQRVLTAILLGIPFLTLLWISDLTRLILLSLLLIFSAIEYLKLRFGEWYKKPRALLSLAGSFGVLALSIFYPASFKFILITSLVINVLLLIDLLVRTIPFHRKFPEVTSILYTSLPYALLITMIDTYHFKYIILSILILIWISDSSAYFVGSTIGRNKLMPSISPGKTLEGFLGAGMITMISSYILFSIMGDYSLQKWFLIGFAVWLFGSVGDLVESKLKRYVNIKDSGSLLPGHGGLLDRFDSFLFCLPFTILIIDNFNR